MMSMRTPSMPGIPCSVEIASRPFSAGTTTMRWRSSMLVMA